MNDYELLKKIEGIELPLHVGIIIDGNRRWARKHILNAFNGHEKGFDILKKIIKFTFKTGIKFLSIYCLSMENLKRKEGEVKHLFKLLKKGLKELREDKDLKEDEVKINIIGRTHLLSEELQEEIRQTQELTKDYNKLTLNLCIAYNGQDEIVDAVKTMINKGLTSNDLNRETIKKHLYTKDSPELDLIIRTGMKDGARISGFLVWDASYAEFIFRDEYWPEYTNEMLIQDLVEYSRRNRRRGK